MSQQNPIARSYQPGACYMCQLCLTCNKKLEFNTCECNITEKPKTSNKKRNFFSRIYNAKNKEKLVSFQINELKRCDKYFGYSSNFDGYFKIFLCTQCHSKFARLKKINTKKKFPSESTQNALPTSLPTSPSSPSSTLPLTSPSTSPPILTEDSIYSSSDYDCDVMEFNFKLIIKSHDGKAKPAKWESFKALTLTEFEDEVLELMQNQFDPFMRKNDYIIIYKSSMYGMGTQLIDEKCWKKFLLEYQKILSNKKELLIIVEIKEKNNKRKQR